jgi:hypothetical protein
MDTLYQKLNKKLDALTKHTQTVHNTERNIYTLHSRLINLSNTKFREEQINTLTSGPNYAVEKDPKQYINELIIFFLLVLQPIVALYFAALQRGYSLLAYDVS